MNREKWEEDQIFEDEVRRIARCMWPQSEFGGATMVQGHETDGVFETEECIHLVESTTSRLKIKAEEDVKKLSLLADEFRKKAGTKVVTCWFITQHEPTADQRGVLAKSKWPVNIISYRQFEGKLIDASSYLSLRINVRFGSVRDPISGVVNPKTGYVALDLVDNSKGETWDVKKMTDQLLNGGHFLILGDYGTGKSMTLREAFQDLRTLFLKGKTPRFPIFINMRDHFGQTDPTEVLVRHARQIGFANPSHLVRAWLAGYGILLIDGFDEVTSLGVQGVWKKLRDTRFQSMEAIRRFVRDLPPGSGLAIAGRPQFFDNDSERRNALGLDDHFTCLNVNEFTEQQLKDYLIRAGCKGQIPSWMPVRPLLVAYLAAKGLIATNDEEINTTREEGWNNLLERIANREAEIEAGIDGQTIRRILERLATKARQSIDGLGPISPDQVIEAFKEICGYAPDGQAMVLLQRLPGLGVDSSGSENRIFVDGDFADTCRAGDVFKCIEDPFNFDLNLFEKSECCLNELGVSVTAFRLINSNTQESKVLASVRHLNNNDADRTLRTDVIRIASVRGDTIDHQTYIRDVVLNNWDLSSIKGNIGKVSFQESYFNTLEIDEDIKGEVLPHFNACFIGQIEGRTGEKDLPTNIFDKECIFDSFSDAIGTTDDILNLTLPLGTKVLLTVLKKLYIRRGTGRRESALRRGLDQKSQRLIPGVLELINSEGLATCSRVQGRSIWFPDRRHMSRIGKMLATPHECKDSVLIRAGELS